MWLQYSYCRLVWKFPKLLTVSCTSFPRACRESCKNVKYSTGRNNFFVYSKRKTVLQLYWAEEAFENRQHIEPWGFHSCQPREGNWTVEYRKISPNLINSNFCINVRIQSQHESIDPTCYSSSGLTVNGGIWWPDVNIFPT